MMNPTVILLALVAISITPVAAQELSDGAIAGIVVGSVVGFIILLILVLLCCWVVFYNQPLADPYIISPRPVINVEAPAPPPQVVTRFFPFGGGPPIIRPEPYPGAPCGPSFGAPRRIGYY
ncbi:uncharacterized protein [Amphiura filiformis]|uniref:uncharacterized protein isoform X1 n=1 Tax=Amphiura filiformis TaxID=82378 RepID=UPI003B219293